MASFLLKCSLALGIFPSIALALSFFNRVQIHSSRCPPFNNGTLNIHQWQLYPDMARFDPTTCLLYIRYHPLFLLKFKPR